MSKVLIKAENLCKKYSDTPVVKNMSFEVREGEFLTLLGPSGCGKTTTLRMIAGFEHPDSGTLELDGQSLIGIPANKRAVNTVFQNYVLFPNMTVRENIGYGLRVKKVSAAETKDRVDEMLKLLKLDLFAERKPQQLSGGQQQRVAIARGLINRPRVILLDEPLAALDLQLRRHMQFELKAIQRQFGTTYVYVTHNQEEAMTMSDRIIVMNGGVIEQIGSPESVYNAPQNVFTARFLGESNILQGVVDSSGDGLVFVCEGVRIPLAAERKDTTCVSIRPEAMHLKKEKTDALSLSGKVTAVTFLGEVCRVGVRLLSGTVIYVLDRKSDFPVGSSVYVDFEQGKSTFLSR